MSKTSPTSAIVPLPPAQPSGTLPLSAALARRRSCREFGARVPGFDQVAELCWAAQGISDPEARLRTAPSAGGLYPLTLYLATQSGLHEYLPADHALACRFPEDIRLRLQGAALDQSCVGNAPLCFVIAMAPRILAARYGDRAVRYCLLEAGHVAQNILLEATALGLAGVPVGAFDDGQVDRALGLHRGQHAVYLIPVGFPTTFVPPGKAR